MPEPKDVNSSNQNPPRSIGENAFQNSSVTISVSTAEGDDAQTCKDFAALDITVRNKRGEITREISYTRTEDGSYLETDTDAGSPGNDPNNPHFVSQRYVLGAVMAGIVENANYGDNLRVIVDGNTVPDATEGMAIQNLCRNNGSDPEKIIEGIQTTRAEVDKNEVAPKAVGTEISKPQSAMPSIDMKLGS